jgi:hypothetical protein
MALSKPINPEDTHGNFTVMDKKPDEKKKIAGFFG